jgi:hypothetical protein
MNPKEALTIVVSYGVGAWFAASALKKMLSLQRVRHWPSIEGTITESVLYQDPARKNHTHFRVQYEFTVGDRIVGSTPRFSGDWFWNNKRQAAFVARYAPGQKVEVFYDPKNPAKNCLDREDQSGIVILWIIVVAATAAATFLVWLEHTK